MPRRRHKVRKLTGAIKDQLVMLLRAGHTMETAGLALKQQTCKCPITPTEARDPRHPAICPTGITVTRRAIYYEAKLDQEFAREIQDARQSADELVISALFRKAMKGNVIAMIFWLKNRQGWRDTHDHVVRRQGEDGEPIQHRAVFADGTPVFTPAAPVPDETAH